jgi:hypothetical protein
MYLNKRELTFIDRLDLQEGRRSGRNGDARRLYGRVTLNN